MILIDYIVVTGTPFIIITIILILGGIIGFLSKTDIGICLGGIGFIFAVIFGVCAIAFSIENQTIGHIKIDDNVTVQELTDTFIIRNYDVENNIWEVKEKEGGIKLSDLNKGE